MTAPNPNEYQFDCLRCGMLFPAEWQYGALVTCPCGAVHETDNDMGHPVTVKVLRHVAPGAVPA